MRQCGCLMMGLLIDHPFSCYVFGLVVCLISMVATSSEFQINKPNLSHDGSLPLVFEAWPCVRYFTIISALTWCFSFFVKMPWNWIWAAYLSHSRHLVFARCLRHRF
uniref:Uncharacterized protein n=1 Tax=Opuntia streptacantha TaxID=393608 RepID=A0A7C8ZWI5_OPUST